MLLNRRAMLSAGIGAIALSVSGCKKKIKTTVIFVNQTAEKVSINASAGGHSFVAKNIQPGNHVTKTYRASAAVGTFVPVTGTYTLGTMPPMTIDLAGFVDIAAGYTNTIDVFDDAPPTIEYT